MKLGLGLFIRTIGASYGDFRLGWLFDTDHTEREAQNIPSVKMFFLRSEPHTSRTALFTLSQHGKSIIIALSKLVRVTLLKTDKSIALLVTHLLRFPKQAKPLSVNIAFQTNHEAFNNNINKVLICGICFVFLLVDSASHSFVPFLVVMWCTSCY